MKDILKKQSVHDEVQELLPWFVNDTLEEKELLRVATHLGECAECQRERDRLQQLQVLVSQEDSSVAADYKPSFEKLMDRIDEAESNVVVPMAATRQTRWIQFAAAASLVVALGSIMVLNQPEPAETLNVTPLNDLIVDPLVNDPLVNHGETRKLTLIFEDGLDSDTLRSAFVETGAYIVSGPDEEGRYIVEVVTEANNEDLIHSMTEVDGVKYAALLD